MGIKMIPCKECGQDMPELRLTKFGYKVCVNCSGVQPKKAIGFKGGSGDHTWDEIKIVSDRDYQKLNNSN